MALLWIEGFEGYGSGEITTYFRRRYQYANAGSPYWYTVTGRVAGYGARANGDGEVRTPALTNSDTAILGCGIKPVTTGTGAFIRLYDGLTLGLDFQFNATTGEISVYRGATLLGTTTGAGIANGVWSYVEIKAKCHSSAGTVEVKVNGVSKLSLSAQNTQAGSHAFWDILAIRMTAAVYHDDLYWCDGTGSINNDWVGIRRVLGIFPSGDSATLEWTPSTVGTHYSLVDEAADATGDYVESGTTGHTDLWDYQDVSDIGAITGIQINTSCRETDAQSFNLLTPIQSGESAYDDAGQAVNSTTLLQKSRIAETDPATGLPWSLAGLNAARIGVKVG